MSCPSWRQSELTSSKMAGIYAAQEHLSDIIDSLETVDDLTDAAQTFADAVREVGEEYRESQSNMVDGFGHDTSMSDELGEKADMLDDWANDIEYLDFESFDEERPEESDYPDDEDGYETAHEEWKRQPGRALGRHARRPHRRNGRLPGLMRKRVVLERIGKYVEIDHGPFRPRSLAIVLGYGYRQRHGRGSPVEVDWTSRSGGSRSPGGHAPRGRHLDPRGRPSLTIHRHPEENP